MKTKLFAVVAATAFAGFTCQAQAQQSGERFALGAQVGTLGFGATAQYKAMDRLVLHADVNTLDVNKSFNSDDLDYDGSLKLSSFSIAADIHPVNNSFFLSAGVASGTKDAGLKATPTSNQEIGGSVYTPAQIGTLTGKISFPKSSTVLGLGYDSTFYKASHIHLRVFAGVQISGSPDVSLTSNGTLANNPAYKASLQQEEQSLQDDADDFKLWPVAQIGLIYRF